MIRKILVPVRGDGKGDNVLAHAAAVAHRYKAHIEVVHCRPRPEDLMPYGVHIPEFLRKQIIEQSLRGCRSGRGRACARNSKCLAKQAEA